MLGHGARIGGDLNDRHNGIADDIPLPCREGMDNIPASGQKSIRTLLERGGAVLMLAGSRRRNNCIFKHIVLCWYPRLYDTGTMTIQPAKAETATSFQPLYAQVYALMTERISTGQWQPGDLLPNEFQLAAEFKVSQGTVRKALMALEANKLIVRRQGHGTYVARHTAQQTLFQFFRIVDLAGTRLTPVSRAFSQKSCKATREQARLLGLQPGAALHAIIRVRYFEEDAAIFEKILIPAALMPDLSVILNQEMPEEMYVIYQQHFGITIVRANEKLAAIAATAEDARHLRVAQDSPLLEITRVASDLNGKPVELRISRCKTAAYRYAAEIT